MKAISIYTFTILIVALLYAQDVTLVELADIPSCLEETSGIEVNNPNRIWSHNDSGGDIAIYGFNVDGVLFETVWIADATNTDWEDLAQDADGNIYIGDFGNNGNNRTNLKIYRIINPDSTVTDTVNAGTIEFSYPDQTEFPPPDSRKNFDCEGFFIIGDSLHLFSKNETEPFTGFTKHYSIPDTPGTYIAELYDSFDTGTLFALDGQITAADISPGGNTVALMSYRNLWLFTGFIGTDFFSGDVLELSIPTITQIEAICFISETEIYITDEVVTAGPFTFGGKLYYVDLDAYLGIDSKAVPDVSELDITIAPNPFNSSCAISVNSEQLAVSGDNRQPSTANRIEIFDLRGTLRLSSVSDIIHSLSVVETNNSRTLIWTPDESISSGIYLVRVTIGNELFTKRIFYLK